MCNNDSLCSFSFARFRAIHKQASSLQVKTSMKDFVCEIYTDTDTVKIGKHATFNKKKTVNDFDMLTATKCCTENHYS